MHVCAPANQTRLLSFFLVRVLHTFGCQVSNQQPAECSAVPAAWHYAEAALYSSMILETSRSQPRIIGQRWWMLVGTTSSTACVPAGDHKARSTKHKTACYAQGNYGADEHTCG